MTIEDIIRKVIREELASLKVTPTFTSNDVTPVEAVVHTPEPEPEEMSDFFEEPSTPEITNTTELLEYLKANCTPVQAKRAKDVVVGLGYERVSLVPDSRAQAVLEQILLEVFN
jgi:hypothetical protein